MTCDRQPMVCYGSDELETPRRQEPRFNVAALCALRIDLDREAGGSDIPVACNKYVVQLSACSQEASEWRVTSKDGWGKRTTAADAGVYSRQKQQAAAVRSSSCQEATRRPMRRLVRQQLARQGRHDGPVVAQPLRSSRVAFQDFLGVDVSRLEILKTCQPAVQLQRRQLVEQARNVASCPMSCMINRACSRQGVHVANN